MLEFYSMIDKMYFKYLALATSIQDIKDNIADAINGDGKINQIINIQWTTDIARIAKVVYIVLMNVIILITPLIITVELIYLCFPVIRVGVDKALVKIESLGIGGKAVGYMVRDARQAVYEAELNGETPMPIYMKLKCKSIMTTMFVLAVVLLASDSVVRFVWDIIMNIVDKIF